VRGAKSTVIPVLDPGPRTWHLATVSRVFGIGLQQEGIDRVIRFENVGVRYGIGPEVLRDISLHIEQDSFYFLTGASGAGKSSLLKLMYLSLFPSRGYMQVFGEDIARTSRRDLPQLRRRIGVVFQDFRLLSHLSIFDNVALPLRLAGDDEKRTRNNVSELLDWVGLGARLHDSPDTLSGGEQQRVAIARAVISKPSLLLADEPTGNVDDRIAYRLVRLFEELHRSGTAVIVATHNDALVRRFSHPVLVLADSELHVPAVKAKDGA
jgi:cell division transport system ATP-binding protein